MQKSTINQPMWNRRPQVGNNITSMSSQHFQSHEYMAMNSTQPNGVPGPFRMQPTAMHHSQHHYAMHARMRYPPVNQGIAYGFVPHVMHGSNVNIPYVVPNLLPPVRSLNFYQARNYAAQGPPPVVPTMPNEMYAGSNSSSNNGNTSSSSSNNSINSDSMRYSNDNMVNIQIGVKCVSQNSQNIAANNVVQTLDTSVTNVYSFSSVAEQQQKQQQYQQQQQQQQRERVYRSPPPPMPYNLNNMNVAPRPPVMVSNTETAMFATPPPNPGNFITPSEAKCVDLIRLALEGGEIAEKLAYNHRNRPCFKKIDSLCARMKQDLVRSDSVMININSQGLAWAVKDFIFVFTRIINAWIIIKGYVYNPAEGLDKIKDVLNAEFPVAFSVWQDATAIFIDSLIKSFVRLDDLVVKQKANRKSDSSITSGNRASSTPLKHSQNVEPSLDFFDSFDFPTDKSETPPENNFNKYTYTMVDDSENTQRKAEVEGSYLTTGTYNPIKKNGNNKSVDELKNINLTAMSQSDKKTLPPETAKASNGNLQAKPEIVIPPYWTEEDAAKLERQAREFALNYKHVEPKNPKELDFEIKLHVLVDRLMNLQNAEMFFRVGITRNYFPDFIAKCKDQFMDVRSILLKCEVGGYSHIYEIVHDLKRITFVAREYLRVNKDIQLERFLYAFEREIKEIITAPPFDQYHFDHIIGSPNETLFFNVFYNLLQSKNEQRK